MKDHSIFSYLRKFEPDIPNTFGEILFEKSQTLQRMYELINVFATQQFRNYLDRCYFLVTACKELKLAKTAHFTQLFQLLGQICIHGDIFYGLPRMLMSKDVKGDVS